MASVPGEGLAGLLSALESEAEAELARADAEARREADALVAAAQAEAAVLERRPVEEQQAELAREVARVVAAARLDAERIERAARDACFERALGALRVRLRGLRARPDYPVLLGALVREARAALPGAHTIRVDPRDVGLVPQAGLALEATLATDGGVVLDDGEGRLVVNTFEERLANAEPALREALARAAAELAGGSAGAAPGSPPTAARGGGP